MESSQEKDDHSHRDIQNGPQSKNEKLRSEFDSLEAEMEIAGYGINQYNRSRRKVSRSESKIRTMKRKSLEKKDKEVSAVTSHELSRQKRIRGSRAALDDDVTMSGLMFNTASISNSPNRKEINQDDDMLDDDINELNFSAGDEDENENDYDSNQDEEEEDDDNNDDAADADDDGDRYEMLADDLDIDIGDDLEEQRENVTKISNSSPKSRSAKAKARKYSGRNIAKTMYKLRNFSSQRMAEKHGDALGAHARGFNKTAVGKLQQVALAAPVAPQIYSSLGLVYESMLRDEAQKAMQKRSTEVASQSSALDAASEHTYLNEQLKLAKKAFASYHVAALLCKMDYSLWVRAGDAAIAITNIHDSFLRLQPNLDDQSKENISVADEKSKNHTDGADAPIDGKDVLVASLTRLDTIQDYILYHKKEKIRWLEEAREDYQTADNQHPPGITVPLKLANTQMELGNLSEALTILTDLKNSSQGEISRNSKAGKGAIRTELEKSYSAWILYADLMLLIGYECERWNQGNQSSNTNYMFRRWLRKFSESFDWKERRLQALCLALEAAAGSKSCAEVMNWSKEQASAKQWGVQDTYETDYQSQVEKSSNESHETEEHHTQHNDGNNLRMDEQSSENKSNEIPSLDYLVAQFNKERQDLLDKNTKEIEAFDNETIRIKESNVDNDLDRERQRKELLQLHKTAVVNLAGTFQEQKLLLSGEPRDGFTRHDLPMSSCCATVFSIASKLMRLLLSMDRFHGSILVAEAVSLYLKQRAARHQYRQNQQSRFEERFMKGKGSLIQLETEAYDDLNSGSCEDDDDDSIVYLSDDEDLDSPDGDKLMTLMKSGVLIPELQVLYGLSLICSGGKDFIAKKMMNALESLPIAEEKDQPNLERGTSDDASFFSFRSLMTEPLEQLGALAFMSEVITKAGKMDQWSRFLAKFYFDFIGNCQEKAFFYHLIESDPKGLSPYKIVQRSNLIKVFFVTVEMKTHHASELLKSDINGTESYRDGMSNLYEILEQTCRFMQCFWRTDPEGNPTSEGKEFLRVMACICSTFISHIETLDFPALSRFLRLIIPFISRMSDTELPTFDDALSPVPDLMKELWTDYPVPSSWQSTAFSRLSQLTRNLCISCNAMAFSGWEKEDFSVRLLKRHSPRSYFGVQVRGTHVAGWLHAHQESSLENQWKVARSFLPSFRAEDFARTLSSTKQAEWLQSSIQLKSAFDTEDISNLGENFALDILLAFSYSFLKRATLETQNDAIDKSLQFSFSILLPMTEFCLDKVIWDKTLVPEQETFNNQSQIILSPTVYENEPVISSKHQCKTPGFKNQFSRTRSRGEEDFSRPAVDPIFKMIKVPTDILLAEWTDKNCDTENGGVQCILSEATKNTMKKLDFNMHKIRKCTTINSLQKRSLQVALCLLEISESRECRNPFLCLYHAAIFAAHGPKGGNNDEELKKPLPNHEECTPQEALNILGRADCLRSIHFTNEAMFLCSYVARVCQLHRDKKRTDMIWSPKWRVIGIFMYTVSIGIDSVISSLTMNPEERKQALDTWHPDVKAEINRSRSDAIAMCKAHNAYDTSSPHEENIHISTGFSECGYDMNFEDKDEIQEEDNLDPIGYISAEPERAYTMPQLDSNITAPFLDHSIISNIPEPDLSDLNMVEL